MNASQLIVQFVNERLKRPGVLYHQAWREVTEENRDLGILMAAQGMTGEKIREFNESLARKSAAPARKVANEKFTELVNALMEGSRHFSYDQAFNRVARERPELIGVGPKENEFTNDLGNPVAGPQNNSLLMLPANASQKMFDAAFVANGKKFMPVKHGDIFNAMINGRVSETGHSYEAALAWCKTTFAPLWKLCEEAAKA